MSRVVVAAPYPTMPGPEAASTLAVVRALLEAGDDVVVVSPVPSAAHHHAELAEPRGAWRLAALAAGADRLVVRLDATAMGAASDPASALPARAVLRVAFRRAGYAEVRLDRVPDKVSRRWAAVVLRPADRVVVASAAERSALLAAGTEASKVVVESPSGTAPAGDGSEGDGPAPDGLAGSGAAAVGLRPEEMAAAAEVDDLRHRRRQRTAGLAAVPTVADVEGFLHTAAIEEREAQHRAAVTARGAAGLPLRQLHWMGRAQTRSAKPGGALAKRLISKALGWQFDNVIQQVNRLHQATLEAVEALERSQDDPAPAGAQPPPDTTA